MKIKPCPFCGSGAELYYVYGRNGYFTKVECDVCGAQSKVFGFGKNEELPEKWYEELPAMKAIAYWNRRVVLSDGD